MGHDDDSERLWRPVFEARNYAEAGMVKGLLEDAGLVVCLESVLGIPHLGFSGRVNVLVAAAEEARGLELVAAYLRQPTPPDEEDQDPPPPCA